MQISPRHRHFTLSCKALVNTEVVWGQTIYTLVSLKKGEKSQEELWKFLYLSKKTNIPNILTSKQHPMVQSNFSLSGQQSKLLFPGRQFHFQSPLCCSFKGDIGSETGWAQGMLLNQLGENVQNAQILLYDAHILSYPSNLCTVS